MSYANEYRSFAEEQLSAAASARLPLVQERHLAAADRWTQLAEEIERFEFRPRVPGPCDYFT